MAMVHESVPIYSPRVSKILAKGEDMTYSEVRYLYKRGLTKRQIAEGSGVAVSDIPKETNAYVPKIITGIEGLTKELYKEYKTSGMPEQAIARLHKISTTRLKDWKDKNFTVEELKSLRVNPWIKRRRNS